MFSNYALLIFLISTAYLLNDSVATKENVKHEQRDYEMIGDENFYFGTEYGSWYSASLNCSQLGMRLLTVDTAERWNMIDSYIYVNPLLNYFYWTSGQRKTYAPSWHWETTGQNFTYTAWGDIEPDVPAETEACMFFKSQTQVDAGTWFDFACAEPQTALYICEPIPS